MSWFRIAASLLVALSCVAAATGNAAAAEPPPDTIACRNAAFRAISPNNPDDANVEAIKKAIACVDPALVKKFEATGFSIFPLPPGHYETFLGFPALAETFGYGRPDLRAIVLNEAVFVEPEQAVSVLAFQMQTMVDWAAAAESSRGKPKWRLDT